MFATYRRIQERRADGEIEEGFTLIELLIVIVVLGILAAVVIFALGGITGKSAVAACKADGATVATAIAAAEAQNPTWGVSGTNGATNSLTTTQLLAGGGLTGDPYLGSWPSNSPHYTYTMSTGALWLQPGTGTNAVYAGPTSCASVV
jgi:prepilin-type N-terminal cleavage/methylation domain-containing protein